MSLWERGSRPDNRCLVSDERNAVGRQYPLDGVMSARDDIVESIFQCRIASPDAHRDVVDEWQCRRVGRWCDRHHVELDRLAFGEVAGKWPPDDGDVDIAAGDRADDLAWRIFHCVNVPH